MLLKNRPKEVLMFLSLLSWHVNTALNNMTVELHTSVCRGRWSAAFEGNPARRPKTTQKKKRGRHWNSQGGVGGMTKKRKACLIVSHVYKVKQGFLSLSIIYQGDLTCHWRNWSQGHTSETRTRTHAHRRMARCDLSASQPRLNKHTWLSAHLFEMPLVYF